jgi:hypothetical protein
LFVQRECIESSRSVYRSILERSKCQSGLEQRKRPGRDHVKVTSKQHDRRQYNA